MIYQSINPFTETPSHPIPLTSDFEVDQHLATLFKGFKIWRSTSFSERKTVITRIAKKLRQNKADLAELMAKEMGKPIQEGHAEVEKSATLCDYYTNNIDTLRQFKDPEIHAAPLGPILGIMPWNYPVWQVCRFAIPTLLIGNTVLIKHAPNVPQFAAEIATLFQDPMNPSTIYQNAYLDHDQVAKIISDDRICGVSFTGSDCIGKIVAEVAGRHLKKVVLELGGSDPFIVYEDADIEAAIEAGVKARNTNSGQVCISAKRFIIHETIYPSFIAGYIAKTNKLKQGDPLSPETTMGPMAKSHLREVLDEQVQTSIKLGATCLIGGKKKGYPNGFFYPPTVMTHLSVNTPVLTDEIFGPVAATVPFQSDNEAIAIANDTRYGLGASVWTKDPERAQHLSTKIEAGSVFINKAVTSILHLPFGGIKASGFGRELGQAGLLSFANIKTVVGLPIRRPK